MPLKQRRFRGARGLAGAKDPVLAPPGPGVHDAAAPWHSKLLMPLTPYRQAMEPERLEDSGLIPPLPGLAPAPHGLTAGGRFEVRVTRHPDDIAAAQGLRYRVFYQEMQAMPTPAMVASGRDFDQFDHLCDHLLVLDHDRAPGDRVVGTYRLLRQAIALRHGGFYSATEYDLAPLLALRGGSLLELGRSCVHADYRTNATIQLLWRGIASYMIGHGTTHMFGCASFAGTDPALHAMPLSYLHHHHRSPPGLAVSALPERRQPMDLLACEQVSLRAAMRAMPPLVKAYLRLGAYIGDGAVVDRQFGTTDVFILLPVDRIGEKYFSHFDRIEGGCQPV